uniref:Speckle-type POZ protein n=1 Tax=Aegilops tauschii TaxID=37682 RepID=M8CAY1_AEGTA
MMTDDGETTAEVFFVQVNCADPQPFPRRKIWFSPQKKLHPWPQTSTSHKSCAREPRAGAVRTTLRSCLVDQEGVHKPRHENYQTITFRKPQDSSERIKLEGFGYIKDGSFSVQCTLDVLRELAEETDPLKKLYLPSSDLHLQLAQLLHRETRADVRFLVSGESFAAHKAILAARSPVFMAEFFGDMKDKDMESAVFKALVQFIYTDTVPEFRQQEWDGEAIYTDSAPKLEQQEEADTKAGTVMTQHLLAAADRYGLDRLKLICAFKLSGGINVDTAATTLTLAEQHNCPELKARCVQFIIKTSATLDAVLATEGYKHLEASCPLVVIDLLRSARGSKT